MLREIELEKIGNFWIDNGIVGLYKILQKIRMENDVNEEYTLINNYDINLYDDKLIIKSKDENIDIKKLLNLAKSFVVNEYLKKTNNYGWFYNENDFSLYQKNDFKMHLKPFFKGKVPSTDGAIATPEFDDSKLGKKGRKMTQEEYQKFIEFKQINNDKKIDNKGFINHPPKFEIGNDFLEKFLEDGDKICQLTGKTFKNVSTVTGMNYPFLTGDTGELNFISYLNEKPKISEYASFISLFTFYLTNYYIVTKEKNTRTYTFYFYDKSLKELSNFYNTIQKDINQLKNPDYASFEVKIVGTVYESESFFNFLLSVYDQVKMKLKKDELNSLITKTVYALSNDGNIFNDVKIYTSISKLFKLFDAFNEYENNNYYEYFLNFIRYFSKKLDNGKYDTTWRNTLCREIIYFQSIHKTTERFMGEVKIRDENSGSIPYLDKIIEIYNNQIQKNMNTKMVEMCKSIGNRIGAYCREKDDKGILYSIRNAKSRIEFLNVLAEIQFRTEIGYSEEFFKELPDNEEWEEYKALISIFAMNSFLYKPNQNNNQNQNNNTAE